MLSARAAAFRLSCAPDYIGKLCRDGKLSGAQVNGAWFVYEASLNDFESSRHAARIARSEELSAIRKQELLNNGFVSKVQTPIAISILHPLLVRIAIASAAVGFIFVASVSITRLLSVPHEESLSAALGQLQSPFFAQQNFSFLLPSTTIFGQLFDAVFASRVNFETKTESPVKTPQPHEPFPVAAVAAESSVVSAALSATSSKVQYAVYPVVEHTVEKVIVENGISQELLTSIVNELAAGKNGAIQYNDNGHFAASSTALVWDDKLSAFTVSGALHADTLCLRGVCLTKAQLQNLISATATSTATSTP